MRKVSDVSALRRFPGRTVLVTGGGAGIGRATALEFAKEGANLIIADIDDKAGLECVELARQLGSEATFIRTDVSKPDDIATLFADIRKSGRPLDIAINNAGVEGLVAPIDEQTDENLAYIFGVNVQGTFRCMREEVRIMKSQESGVIINFASIASHVGFPGMTIYTASKAAILAMTKSAALELARTGIRVASVSPGLVQTAMLDRVYADNDEARDQMFESLPLGRACDPYEIARGVLFLASDDASLVVGQTINLDGAWAFVQP